MLKDLKLGDTAWWARCGDRELTETCPICFGELKVHLILGNGETVELECEYCGKGVGYPIGSVKECAWIAEPEIVVISSISSECRDNGCEVRYGIQRGYSIDAENLFATKEEALDECDKMIKKRDRDEFSRVEYLKQNNKKNYSWNAGYWKRQIKRAKKDIENWSKKYIVCKERSKEREKTTT